MTEGGIIWGAAVTVTAIVLIGYIAHVRRRARQHRERVDEARRLGIDKPTGLFPFIDPTVCIGCGTCVKACPEGDVLAMVGGLATVAAGARCIGIGQCGKVCPVGAIEISAGALKGRADVPIMNDVHETNVEDVFIAGELGGLALIRNAVEQGRTAVRAIGRRIEEGSSEKTDVLDLAIVGAGPSGLSAALTAAERNLRYVVLEQQNDLGGTVYQYPRQKLTHTQPVELPLYGMLKRDEYTKEELLTLFTELVDRHHLNIRFGQRVTGANRSDGGGFQIQTAAGSYHARHLLLALGRRGTPRKLGVPGERLPKVMYQVRDASQFQNCRIVCVGGGDSAIEAALGLARQKGNDVVLSYRKEQFFRIKKKNRELLDKWVDRGRIRPLMRTHVREITESAVRVATDSGEIEIANDAVFVLIGGEPPFPLLRQIGIRFGSEADGSAASMNAR